MACLAAVSMVRVPEQDGFVASAFSVDSEALVTILLSVLMALERPVRLVASARPCSQSTPQAPELQPADRAAAGSQMTRESNYQTRWRMVAASCC